MISLKEMMGYTMSTKMMGSLLKDYWRRKAKQEYEKYMRDQAGGKK